MIIHLDQKRNDQGSETSLVVKSDCIPATLCNSERPRINSEFRKNYRKQYRIRIVDIDIYKKQKKKVNN